MDVSPLIFNSAVFRIQWSASRTDNMNPE